MYNNSFFFFGFFSLRFFEPKNVAYASRCCCCCVVSRRFRVSCLVSLNVAYTTVRAGEAFAPTRPAKATIERQLAGSCRKRGAAGGRAGGGWWQLPSFASFERKISAQLRFSSKSVMWFAFNVEHMRHTHIHSPTHTHWRSARWALQLWLVACRKAFTFYAQKLRRFARARSLWHCFCFCLCIYWLAASWVSLRDASWLVCVFVCVRVPCHELAAIVLVLNSNIEIYSLASLSLQLQLLLLRHLLAAFDGACVWQGCNCAAVARCQQQ